MLGCGEERNEKESMKSKINLTEQHQRTARMRRNVAIRNATRKKRIHKKKNNCKLNFVLESRCDHRSFRSVYICKEREIFEK